MLRYQRSPQKKILSTHPSTPIQTNAVSIYPPTVGHTNIITSITTTYTTIATNTQSGVLPPPDAPQ